MGYGRIQIKIFPLFVETRSGCNCAGIALGQKFVGAVADLFGDEFLISGRIAGVSFLRNKMFPYFGIVAV